MDFETLKIIDYELEYCVRNGVPPKMGKSPWQILNRSATVKNAVYSMFFGNFEWNSKETAAWAIIPICRRHIDADFILLLK